MPNSPLMGWAGTIEEEQTSRDGFASSSDRYCEVTDITKYSPDPVALQKIQSLAHFDSGFDFTIAEELVYGSDLEPGPQNIGNCVGYSHCMLLASKIAHEIFVEKQPEQPLSSSIPIPYIPYSYGAGRVYVGDNRIRGDGSNCSWQIQASMEHGFLPCDNEIIKSHNALPQDSVQYERLYGSSKRDLDVLRPFAINFDLTDSTVIKSVDEAKHILTEVYSPIQICSNWGFAPQRNKDAKYGIWIYVPSGTWGHSMQIVGWIRIKGTEFVHVRNQWGRNAHKDNTPIIPLGGFLITIDTFSRWLKDAYAATIGEIKGKAKNWVFPF